MKNKWLPVLISSFLAFCLNAVALEVQITAPTNNATVSETVNVSGTSDITVGRISVSIDGGAFETATGFSPWSYSWDTTTVSDGAYTLSARAGETMGGPYVTNTVGVVVNNGATNPVAVSSTGPLTHWTLDETAGLLAMDSSTNGLNGDVTGAVWTNGIVHGALDFDGVDDQVQIAAEGDVPDEIANLEGGTISFWVKYHSISNGAVIPESLPLLYYGQTDDTTGQNGVELYIGHNGLEDPAKRQLYFTVHTGGVVNLCFDSNEISLEPETWYHYAVVIGPGDHRGYINGVEFDKHYNAGTGISNHGFFATVAEEFREILTMGYGRFSSQSFWHHNGLLDDVRIYDRALAASEIAWLYDRHDKPVGGNLYFDSLYDHAPAAGVLDGIEKTVLVTGYSTSHQPADRPWPTILHEMLNEHAGNTNTYHVYSHTIGSTPIAKWTDICGTGEHVTNALALYVNPGTEIPPGIPTATIMLAQQSLQWSFGDCDDRFMSITGPDDQVRIDQGEAAIGYYTDQFINGGVERVYMAMHIFKTGGYDLDLYGERYALVEALDTAGNLYPGPELWSVTRSLFPDGFAADLVHPGPEVANTMALYWYLTLAGDDAKYDVAKPVADAAGVDIPIAFDTPAGDWDNDGMPEVWEVEHFGSTTATNGGAGNDFDGDGVLNSEEYPAGTDPDDQDSLFEITMEHSGENILVSFPTIASGGIGYDGTERYYSVEWRTNLLEGGWLSSPGFSTLFAEGQTVIHTNQMDSNPLYYRASVWLQ